MMCGKPVSYKHRGFILPRYFAISMLQMTMCIKILRYWQVTALFNNMCEDRRSINWRLYAILHLLCRAVEANYTIWCIKYKLTTQNAIPLPPSQSKIAIFRGYCICLYGMIHNYKKSFLCVWSKHSNDMVKLLRCVCPSAFLWVLLCFIVQHVLHFYRAAWNATRS